MKNTTQKKSILNQLLLAFIICSIGILNINKSYAQIPTAGLVAYYPFNDNAADESGNGNDGTVNGATLTQDRFGNNNSAYSFDGIDDNILLPNIGSFNAFTVAMWINIETFSQNRTQSPFGSADWNYGSMHFNIEQTGDSLQVAVNDGGGGYLASNHSFVNDTNKWVHIAFSYVNGGNSELYINGILDQTHNYLTTVNFNNMIIGDCFTVDNRYFNGKIDDIRFYNRALIQSEITALYYENYCAQGISVTDTINKILFDGRDCQAYPIEKIGNQWWMTKNLNVATYSDGTTIPNETNSIIWSSLTSGALSYYNNDSAQYAETYGALYNWYAVNDSRGVCPTGWHMPSDGEWNILGKLIDFTLDTTNIGLIGTDVGEKLKESGTNHWAMDYGTNSSGFTALPSGYRHDGTFSDVNYQGYFWASTEEDISNSFFRGLYFNSPQWARTTNSKNNGFSVRCMKNKSPIILQPVSHNVCENETTIFTVETNISGSSYQWQVYDGTVWMNLMLIGGQYMGNFTDSLEIIGVTATMDNYQYRCIVSSGTVSDTSNVATLTVAQNYNETLNVSIYEGESYYIGSNSYSTTGTYTNTFTSTSGCDSIVTLNLTVKEQICNWSYKKSIEVNNINNSENLSDYSVLVIVNTSDLIASGKMNADGSDIRFVNENNTSLNYWIEPGIQGEFGINKTTTHIWVKVPQINGYATTNIYMLYGNQLATAKSNISNTFLFGDDFEDGTIDVSKWDVITSNQGQLLEQNGKIVHNSPKTSPDSQSDLFSKQSFEGSFVLEMQFKKGGYVYRGIGLLDSTVAQNRAWVSWWDSGEIFASVDVAGTSNTITFQNDHWSREFNPEYYIKMIRKADGTFYYSESIPAFEPDGAKFWEQNMTNPIMPLNTPLKVSTHEGVWLGAWWLWDRYEDDIRVRKYSSPEPTTILGTELYNQIYQDTTYINLCFGEIYNVGSISYSESTIFADTLTSVTGCDSILVTNLSIATSPVSATIIELSNNSCFDTNDGFITLSVSGGNSPYSYNWSNGDTTASITGLSNGFYFATITDSYNCSTTITDQIIEPSLLYIELNNATINQGESATLSATVYGGIPAYQYSWSNGAISSSITVSPIATTNYSLTVTDAVGCIAEASTTVAVNQSGSIVYNYENAPKINDVYLVAVDTVDQGVISVGNSGFDQSWDLTALENHRVDTNHFVVPENVVLYSEFPTADMANVVSDLNGFSSAGFVNVDNESFSFIGYAADPMGNSQYIPYKINPKSTIIKFPTQMGTNFNESYDMYMAFPYQPYYDSIKLVNHKYVESIIDGSGVVQIPSGSYNALRQKNKENAIDTTYVFYSGQWQFASSSTTTSYVYRWISDAVSIPVATIVVDSVSGSITRAEYYKPQIAEPVAQFKTLDTINIVNQPVQFIDLSLNNPTSWSWNFSDGFTSTEQHPLHTFTTAGSYTVSLEAFNLYGSNIIVKTIEIGSSLSVSLPVSKAICNNEAVVINSNVNGGVPPYSYTWSNDTYNSWCGVYLPGYYYLTVTDSLGESASDTVFVYTNNIYNIGENQLSVSVDYDTVCTGSAVNVSIHNSQSGVNYQLIINGAYYGYEYTGHGGTISFSSDILNSNSVFQIIARSPGTECELVLNTNITIIVTNDYFLNVNITKTNVTCNGLANGTATVTAIGGSGNYVYSWSMGGNGASVQGLAPGDYFVVVMNSVVCPTYEYFTISQPNALNLTYTTYPVTNGSNGMIDLSVSGGTVPYYYNWSNGMSTQDLAGLQGGVYNVTVADSKGCQAIANILVSAQGCSMSLTPLVTDATCYSSASGSVDITVNNGTAPYQYIWSNGGVSASLNNLVAGNYTVTVTDIVGCVTTASVNVNEPDEITFVKLVTDANCTQPDGSVSIFPYGGVSPYSYLWSDGNTTNSITNVPAGNYSVVISDENNCSVEASILINNYNAPVVTFTQITSPTCYNSNDGSATIEITGGVSPYTYLWNSGGTGLTENGLSGGAVNVTISDSYNCSVIGQAILTSPSSINIQYSATDVLFGNDGSIILNVIGGVMPLTYLWSNGGASASLSNLSAGTYNVTVSDANLCTANTTINVGGTPCAINISSSTYDALCYNQPNGYADISVSNGQQPYTYHWSNGRVTEDLINVVAGTYNFTVTDSRGCTANTTVVINQPSALAVNVNSTPANCGLSDGELMANVTGGTSPYNYQWSTGDTTSTVINIAAGYYMITVTDVNSCSKFAVAMVNNNSTLDVTVNSVTNVSCNGGNNGAINISVSGGTSPYIYDWSNGSASEDISGIQAGPYEIMVSDNYGCMSALSIEVTQPDVLTINTNITPANCGNSDGTATAIVTGGTAPYTYLWTTGDVTASVSGLVAGNYSVVVTDSKSCMKIKSVAISNDNGPVISNSVITEASCNSSNGSIDITISGGSMPFIFGWSNTTSNEDLSGVSEGSYSVTITDDNGCVTAGNFTVTPQMPFENPICVVMVDSITNRNKIIWEKVQSSGIDHYNLYKESTMAGIYQLMASIPYSDLSEYVDLNANPSIRSWRYKISAVDLCGNESSLSEYHKTMHLTINEGLGQSINLIWDHYEGFTFYSYDIYRHTSSNGWELIQTMPNNLTSFTDNPGSVGQLYYKIVVDKGDSCWASSVDKTQTGPYSQSISNIDDYAIWTGIKEVKEITEFTIYPNPVKNQLTIEIQSSKFQVLNLKF